MGIMDDNVGDYGVGGAVEHEAVHRGLPSRRQGSPLRSNGRRSRCQKRERDCARTRASVTSLPTSPHHRPLCVPKPRTRTQLFIVMRGIGNARYTERTDFSLGNRLPRRVASLKGVYGITFDPKSKSLRNAVQRRQAGDCRSARASSSFYFADTSRLFS
jgi:hypothetical protein